MTTIRTINELLHDLRSEQLMALPKGAEVFLTAGASGTWYFDWISQCYGKIPKHIAIEKYSPRPADLPEGVEWIPESVGDMASVANNSVDLFFSGQNIEHLWVPEIVGSLVEASRVLRPNGLLVIDSPNRAVTAVARDAHPEHVVEFNVEEAKLLAEAAGFEVTRVVGLWLCIAPESNDWLTINSIDSEHWTDQRRIEVGKTFPENSYVWWMEARKKTRANPAKLLELANQVYSKAWPERLTRTHSVIGQRVTTPDGNGWFEIPEATAGAAMFGPYAPLVAGHYTVTFTLESQSGLERQLSSWFNDDVITLEVFSDKLEKTPVITTRVVRGKELAEAQPIQFDLTFDLDELVFGVQFRVISHGKKFAFKVKANPKLIETIK